MKALATTLGAVKATRSRTEKRALLEALLKPLSGDALVAACRIVAGAPLAVGDRRALGVGAALVVEAAAAAAGLDEAALLKASRAAGDLGAGLEALWPAGRPGLALDEALELFEALAAAEGRDAKRARLVATLGRASGAEARYLVGAMLGELRVGVQRSTLDEALAAAFGASPREVRAASALTPDVGTLARLVQAGALASVTATCGHVIAFMLASPTEAVKEPVDPAHTLVEDKLDGVRVQAHVAGGEVRLFARGLGEVSTTFPDVVAALAPLGGPLVLDGELIAVTPAGGPRPFQALQARLGRAAPAAAVARTPVAFVAFDLLLAGDSLLTRPFSERRARLERLDVRVNPVTALDASLPLDAQLDALYAAARARGHEGLVLKRTDAPYEAGARGSAWRKVKRALATLDVVITRAERGHGKRAGLLSDYTFAVWAGATLVELGKAYSGLTDAELAELTERLKASAFGPEDAALRVRPEIVLEVAFDGLQPSTRHASGFALRFPRIVRLRLDKRPEEADRLEVVQALFEGQVRSGHREAPRQLGLFDDAARGDAR
ncbi:MAG: ATP-dependent DNA ligase [Myxococcaceae bacterium]|nr:ATP-dependent DNA ligase [Myxococcaceae bacterium]MCA3014899.1 ATP-dependent DNA ligase [Myxococcaceae bacterium]